MSTSTSGFPEDLYPDILSRLPANSLLVCKCVCKSWFSLISNPTFVNLHLKVTVQTNNPSLMLESFKKNRVIHSIKYDSLSSEATECADINEMDYPFKSSASRVEVVGSCNGLICILIKINYYSFLCIWNPATNEYKILPETPDMNYCWKDLGTFGFGYDCNTDDYKVVNFVDNSSLVEVYTLSSNSWKSIEAAIPYLFYRGTGVLMNGALHWLGYRHDNKDSNLLISFEIHSKKFNELLLPKERSEDRRYWFWALEVLEGCLCLICDELNTASPAEVWVMQDYGVQESWTKISTIIRSKSTEEHLMVIGSLKNDKILLLSNLRNLVLHDKNDGSSRKLNVSCFVNLKSGVKYFETLVSLNSGTYLGREAHVEESVETRKRKRKKHVKKT